MVNLGETAKAKIRLKVVSTGQEIVTAGRSELTIGRTYKNMVPDIDLGPYGGSKAGVSRRHARLIFRDGRWHVEDLDSTNGTFINGVKVTPHQLSVLSDGDVIRCGQIELTLKIE
jgi:pSer/pThr/pTyr-binding forkhead associated (FHA) protein